MMTTTTATTKTSGGASFSEQQTSSSPLLAPLLIELPLDFEREILDKLLSPTDRALFSHASRAWRAAVKSSELPYAGWQATHGKSESSSVDEEEEEKLEKDEEEGFVFELEDFMASVSLLAWAKANSCPWENMNPGVCMLAASEGHLDTHKFAVEQGCKCDDSACSWAAGGGHVHVMVWLKENIKQWASWYACYSAACGNQLRALQWLHHNGCPWDQTTCSGAALFGYLDILMWARANDCEWTEFTIHEAIKGGHVHVLRWA
jgi:hypothetical protein